MHYNNINFKFLSGGEEISVACGRPTFALFDSVSLCNTAAMLADEDVSIEQRDTTYDVTVYPDGIIEGHDLATYVHKACLKCQYNKLNQSTR